MRFLMWAGWICVFGAGACASTATPLTDGGAFDTAGSDVNAEADRTSLDATPRDDASLPTIPIGLDILDSIEAWPRVRIGARTIMRSTFDRRGGNESGDASHFVRSEAVDRFVTLDVVGPGVLAFVRTNHWHGSPWHYEVDGVDTIVSETSTATPNMPVAGSTFLPADAFPSPLTFTWATTNGADLNWVPIAFTRSMELAWSRTRYGTGYFIVHRFAEGADNLSAPITSWTPSPPRERALEVIRRSGMDLTPAGPDLRDQTVMISLGAGARSDVLAIDGRRTIRALELSTSASNALALGRARIAITWDDEPTPSVDVPVALFFGTGTLYSREGRTLDEAGYLVRALPVSVRYRADRVELASYFPMPFATRARIELIATDPISDVSLRVRTIAQPEPTRDVGYLHATFHDFPEPERGRSLVLLDTTVDERGREWCGQFVGTAFQFSDRAVLVTLEGDPRFYFDDARAPQGYGTGTEEWGGGGDYWGGLTMSLPFAGHPTGARSPGEALDREDQIESAYRFLLLDAFPFGRNARIELEHGAENDVIEHYRTATFWYGRPGACLVRSDEIDIGNEESERAHRYSSPTATAPYSITAVPIGSPLVADPITEDGRLLTGASEMTIEISPENAGLLIRRVLDLRSVDQRADVFIADDRDDAAFEHVGSFYTAGSDSCVYSDPPGELDGPISIRQQSNRRYAEEELLVARRFTRGRSRVRLRVVTRSSPEPLIPGDPLPAAELTELRYVVYSWIAP